MLDKVRTQSVKDMMTAIARRARAAAPVIARASTEKKNAGLLAAAEAIETARADILAANAEDCANAERNGVAGAMLDRLRLDERRLAGIVGALREVAALPDPVGETVAEWTRPNGLKISRVRVPIGVIAVIYESRPNVTIDAGALCLKSGNAAILRGGSESFASSRALHACFARGLEAAGLPAGAVQLVPTTDRAAVGYILAGLDGAVDLIIPRGGKSLVARVQAEARAPVLGHLEGVCHVYVDRDADIDKAVRVVVNAKMRRPGVCGAAETVLIDGARLESLWPPIGKALREAGCAIRADAAIRALDPETEPAREEDWGTEYLGAIIAAGAVDGVAGAIDHIARYGTAHTDAVVTENPDTAARFLAEVDSAIVMHNASTQFADGGEFGLGAEIGIATGRLHARGPVGLAELTTYKNVVRGDGHVRE
ncbi:glutamate-5-semialdehyde dehydrogenase [Amphiplicatus metriothermophilus]|uniref:Gamma-glutamyl phosphate reductase n=1 Tax=Amphiplicatus metriothermophilus TaxID=1519374 RepID=A0A239PQL8_9PROT|nr:glutamate-5-semialdehyde dehydrogenase [Amphiplicatus metriothermophilus]MBB5518610.1 glutamate-5-semialdehyde dehydrogenase [Amphiplicatus metriothermophilus]SNT72232.1 glutamate-5-semialdehyde dehydrogenase [Amphiplicatus metriothermophilus]